MEREGFRSRLGFILVSAGCAIGIGNVWKFPYIAGENGGGLFVLIYLLFLLMMGIPILSVELALGRASRKSIVKAYKMLEPQGSKWHIHGWICLIGNYILMMFYTSVSGWMVDYGFKFAFGRFSRTAADQVESIFNDMLSNPLELTVFLTFIVITGFLVCAGGVKNGLERVSKWMMLALLALIVVLAVNSVFLSGAAEGFKFYLLPDFGSVEKVGLFNIISKAMSQAFFTLGLGIGSMQIFGSYMSKDNALTGEAVRITLLDTIVAVMSGLIIFPACFSYNVAPSEGPSLIFITLPKIFINMPFGRVWGTLFFVFMSFASFSTLTAVFENLISSCIDNFGWTRKKSTVINCIIVLVTSMPCLLGFNLLSGVQLFGMGILDMEDFLVSDLLLPIGALIFLVFSAYRFGWGFENFRNEANAGKGMKIPKALGKYFKYILPLLLLFVLISGFIQK